MTTALYYPYKAVGYVTDGSPFYVNRLGDETFLTVSIGKSFQVVAALLRTYQRSKMKVKSEEPDKLITPNYKIHHDNVRFTGSTS